MKNINKGLSVLGAGIVCGAMAWQTHGEHGIGWFILCLFLIL